MPAINHPRPICQTDGRPEDLEQRSGGHQAGARVADLVDRAVSASPDRVRQRLESRPSQ